IGGVDFGREPEPTKHFSTGHVDLWTHDERAKEKTVTGAKREFVESKDSLLRTSEKIAVPTEAAVGPEVMMLRSQPA
ncbi:MAG: hypothetical protein ABJ251_00900, partial [Paracoccaceae bacterium]